ncbi:MAG TPA: transposase [Candidatus Cloacimonadota bacterium]|nr:transposase [Candidatus Cloacimonadota bacterium]HPT71142.1 transposase [Candidatus Cloacimonadota bacterium]
MKNLNTIGKNNLKYNYYSSNLPHKYDNLKPIFITFRLKFTLPKYVLLTLSNFRDEWQKKYHSLSDMEKQDFMKNKEFCAFNRFDELITESSELPQILSRDDLTDIVSKALKYFDNKYYNLLSYCIMPNHVHVLIIPISDSDVPVSTLARINYSWKRYTANQINKILNRKGGLWQTESYDHLIRSDSELITIFKYIINNPVKAGLVQEWKDWRGTWIKDEYVNLVQELIL